MNRIPIYLAADDVYAKYLSVALVSLIENTDSNLEINILDGGIKIENKKKLEQIHKINFINVENLIEPFQKDWKNSVFSANAFARLFIKDVRKYIYLDSDIVVNGNIVELYNQHLNKKPLGAIPTYAPLIKNRNKNINIGQKHRYFNSGVLLIDGKKFNSNSVVKLLQKNKYKFPDQDALNVAYENKYKQLDWKFNVFIHIVKSFSNKKLKDSIIIHYTDWQWKPWNNKIIFSQLGVKTIENQKYANNVFWKYAKLSPFYNEILNNYKINNPKGRIKRYIKYKILKPLLQASKIKES
jgi:lipopolysaccharide biosynthesis glycosyltransferase